MGVEPTCGTTERLSQWAVGLAFSDIPAEVRRAVSWLMLDGLGCGLFGSTTPWGGIVSDLVTELGGSPEATVWGTGVAVPALQAPLANGTFMHSFEFDDLHAAAVIHGGAQVIPAALAIAELRANAAASGRTEPWLPGRAASAEELVVALVAGLEVGARIGLATGAHQLARGFHPSPNTGTFSAAVVAARLLDLDETGTRNALGIAGSCGGSLMAAQYGAMVKRMHPGRAAQAGVLGALLAARGFTGIDDIIEAPYGGFAHAYAGLDSEGTDQVVVDLGEHWETSRFSPKAYPCCGSNHTSIDAYRTILEEEPALQAQDIESIEIRCSTLTADHVGWPYQPDSVTSAQMNLSYTVAVMAHDRRIFVDQFTPDRIKAPDVVDLATRVRIVPDPEIDALGKENRHTVRLTVATHDGRRLTQEVRHARGSAHHRLSTEEVAEKYRGLASSVLGADAVGGLESAVLELGADAPAGNAVTRILELLTEAARQAAPDHQINDLPSATR